MTVKCFIAFDAVCRLYVAGMTPSKAVSRSGGGGGGGRRGLPGVPGYLSEAR